MNSKAINIVSATLIDKYKLRLGFDDGAVQEVDFGTFLGKAQHLDIRAYLDETVSMHSAWSMVNWCGATMTCVFLSWTSTLIGSTNMSIFRL